MVLIHGSQVTAFARGSVISHDTVNISRAWGMLMTLMCEIPIPSSAVRSRTEFVRGFFAAKAALNSHKEVEFALLGPEVVIDEVNGANSIVFNQIRRCIAGVCYLGSYYRVDFVVLELSVVFCVALTERNHEAFSTVKLGHQAAFHKGMSFE